MRSRHRRPNGRGERDIDWANLRAVVGCSALFLATMQATTATLAIRRGRRDYADAVWGPGLASVAVIGALMGRGDAARRWGLAAVTTAWAARLALHLAPRMAESKEEDPRYTEFLEGDGTATVLGKVFVTQGIAQLIVSAPLQLAAASRLPAHGRRRLAPAGIAVMVAGAAVEALADLQKSRYSALPEQVRPEVLDTGLWGLSRHPNYFGDSLVWDGAWLAAAASAPGGLSVFAPLTMNYLLILATGARRTERRMRQRPGYAAYQRRVGFFFPRPPRRS